MFEVFEHTADLGLRIGAPDLNSLFSEAGRGLFSLIVENVDEAQPRLSQDIKLTATTIEDLLFDWLSELLYLFDARHLVLCQFQVTITGTSLSAAVSGEPLDRSRHRLLREVKAITYHGLSVKRSGNQWEAEVIVDV